MNIEQIDEYQKSLSINKGDEWDLYSGLDSSDKEINKFLSKSFFNSDKRIYEDKKINIEGKIFIKLLINPILKKFLENYLMK